ncbi:unnamed protein product [Prunus armeniaca]|uniref:Uncharacterized protein n=1 Tax=Prunus armeniaca TaxID=36596 RepID=A0A6J5Y175_PRUAR|nr:unnamed protein product [Prunus armeniaca]
MDVIVDRTQLQAKNLFGLCRSSQCFQDLVLNPKGREKESQAKNKRYMTMMVQLQKAASNDHSSFGGWGRNSHGLVNSLTCLAELDSSNPKLMNESLIIQIARGSGLKIREVMEMFEEYKRLAKIWSKMKGLKIPKKAYEQRPFSPDAEADWWHGQTTEFDEANGF